MRSLESTLKISPFFDLFLKKPHQTEIAPPRRSSSQAVAASSSMSKSIATGGMGAPIPLPLTLMSSLRMSWKRNHP